MSMDDLISRADVIEILATMQGLCRSKEALVQNSKIWQQIKDMPSAQKTGKWTRENNYGRWKCSECGCIVNRANPLKGNIWNYNYCPNCGADMRGDDND